MNKPDYLSAGDYARLFPVLATTSKEGRTTSIVLACLARIDELGAMLLGQLGQRIGVRTNIDCYTEVVFKGQKDSPRDRPDGLIIVQTGAREWRALVEAKVGSQKLDADQIEKYREIAKEQKIDCVISISNEFATTPQIHPMESVRKSRSKIPVYHWSWMAILTAADLLITNDGVKDLDQLFLLRELTRFLTHESAGVSGFDRMPPEWTELNRLVFAGGRIPAKSEDALAVLGAWHQECKDLTLILSRQTETPVAQRLSRKHINDPATRLKDEYDQLREHCQLSAVLDIPDTAAPLEITADLQRRTVDVGMTVKSPDDRKSSKARMNWLLKQIRGNMPDDLQIRCSWPGRSDATQFSYSDIMENSSIIEDGKNELQVLSFHIFISRRFGGRFTQQTNFIADLEKAVPEFYRLIGQNLSAWQKSAPKIKQDRETSEEVSVAAIEEDVAVVRENFDLKH